MRHYFYTKDHKKEYWRHLKDRVDDLKDLGITHLWLPPPSQSVSPEGCVLCVCILLLAASYIVMQLNR